MLATDGVFDNLPEPMLIAELIKVQGNKDPLHLQTSANAIVLMVSVFTLVSIYTKIKLNFLITLLIFHFRPEQLPLTLNT